MTVIVVRDGEVLVERRADDPGVWALVGGALEQDETVLETLARTLRDALLRYDGSPIVA